MAHSVASIHSYAGDRPVGYCVDTPVLAPALMKDMLQFPKRQSAFRALGRTAIKYHNRPVLQYMVYLAYVLAQQLFYTRLLSLN